MKSDFAIYRPPAEIARYTMFKHEHEEGNPINEFAFFLKCFQPPNDWNYEVRKMGNIGVAYGGETR